MVFFLLFCSYKLRTEALLMREEFTNTMDWMRPSIEAIRHSAKDLKDSKEIHEIFYLVLIAGNFINAVSLFCQGAL